MTAGVCDMNSVSIHKVQSKIQDTRHRPRENMGFTGLDNARRRLSLACDDGRGAVLLLNHPHLMFRTPKTSTRTVNICYPCLSVVPHKTGPLRHTSRIAELPLALISKSKSQSTSDRPPPPPRFRRDSVPSGAGRMIPGVRQTPEGGLSSRSKDISQILTPDPEHLKSTQKSCRVKVSDIKWNPFAPIPIFYDFLRPSNPGF